MANGDAFVGDHLRLRQAARQIARVRGQPLRASSLRSALAKPAPTALPRGKAMFLAVGLAGSFLTGISAQLPSVNISDIQAGIASTPDEASWILTVYTMTSFAGIVMSGTLIRSLGLGRYLVLSSVVFALCAAACAAVSDLNVTIALRAVQGLAAGGFGPAAFATVFTVAGGPLLPFGLTLLAFALLFPAALGPVISAIVEDSLGWRSLFQAQAVIGAALALAAFAWIPRLPPEWSALKTDWVSLILLSSALASAALVVSQGTRRFWFESSMIAWATAISIGAAAGFAFLARFSPATVISSRLLFSRAFGVPILLNLVFRTCAVVTVYLAPQFLAIVQGYRPSEVAQLSLWAVISQLVALPLTWRLMQLADLRVVMGLGLVICCIGTATIADGTSLFAADQFQIVFFVTAVGQFLFLAPTIVIGASPLKPAELQTASIAFNATTLGGATLGVGLASHIVAEREKFHSNAITETISLYDPFDAGRIASLTTAFGDRITDDGIATARAVATIAAAARREAWVLAFNDAFLLVAIVLAIGALGVLILNQTEPLRHSRNGGPKP
jgi:DHA2 family multidrug resistance protein